MQKVKVNAQGSVTFYHNCYRVQKLNAVTIGTGYDLLDVNFHRLRIIMRNWFYSLIYFIGLISTAAATHADVVQGEQIEVELVSETLNVAPGQTLWVAIRLTPTEGWHTYSKWLGDSGDPTMIHEWQLPAGAIAGEIQWPNPTWLPFPGSDLVTFSYENEIFLPVAINVPDDFSASSFPISADVEWQVCDDICIIGRAVISTELPVSQSNPQIDPRWSQAFSSTRANFPLSDHGVEALFAMEDDKVSFSFVAEEAIFENVTEAWFFPEIRRILKPGPLREVSIKPTHIQITQAQPRRVLNELQEFDGLLTLADASGKVRGFEVSLNKTSMAAMAAISAAAADSTVLSSAAAPSLWVIIVFAITGGLILNLMPCVFPVLSLKILSFASSGDSSGRQQKLHGLSYTAGIVITFMLLASILLALRAGGEAVGWAFQLQSPVFNALIILLFFTMGLSLSGVYEFGTGFMGVGANLTQKKGLKGSFFTGVLATLVASPCTAPFMGAALGFALSQSWLIAMLVFIFLGIGMALPFLLLSFSPRLLKFMPKPGQWMVRFKEFMAFPLYLTALYFLWVLGIQTGVNGVAVVAGACLLVAFAMWLLQQRSSTQGFWRSVTLVIGMLSIAGALSLLSSSLLRSGQAIASAESFDDVESAFIPFSAQGVADLRASGTPVFVNMTAAWCITCLANEQTTLNTERVQNALQQLGITYMKGDWTNQDPEISRVLDQFNRPSVPLYIFYPADPAAEPVLLPQILTPSIVIEVFNNSINT
jgi:thiol:disulfide interchange protein/DsbC/DsbD-like thiol-disulfide interchange protein